MKNSQKMCGLPILPQTRTSGPRLENIDSTRDSRLKTRESKFRDSQERDLLLVNSQQKYCLQGHALKRLVQKGKWCMYVFTGMSAFS